MKKKDDEIFNALFEVVKKSRDESEKRLDETIKQHDYQINVLVDAIDLAGFHLVTLFEGKPVDPKNPPDPMQIEYKLVPQDPTANDYLSKRLFIS